MKDYYGILGLNPNATNDDVDRAYRKLALQYHPDKNPEDQEKFLSKFKEIQEAYEYLINSKSKIQFDFRNKNSVDDVFDNILSKYFGNQNINNSSRVRIKISLEESYFGCFKDINTNDYSSCVLCEGTGGLSWIPCDKCSGKGFIYDKNKLIIQATCCVCEGKGSIVKEKCGNCKGQGFTASDNINIKVEVPSGIKDGTQIIIQRDSNNSELYVLVNIEKHNKFSRDKQNLVCDLDVPYNKLFLGGKIYFKLFDQDIKVNIKPRTNPGSKIIIKNQGFSFMENSLTKGDLILNIKLKFPDKINKELKDIICKLEKYE